ncbi:MAG TPA: hypothetical protein H9976_00865 [Candidatus Akkermansia intestinavium]|nr:hypothetical protein [Candidatus Akkermansia intestinavium]
MPSFRIRPASSHCAPRLGALIDGQPSPELYRSPLLAESPIASFNHPSDGCIAHRLRSLEHSSGLHSTPALLD